MSRGPESLPASTRRTSARTVANRWVRDGVIVVAVFAIFVAVAGRFQLSERLQQLVRDYEYSQLDEIVLGLGLASFVGFILSTMRWRERGRRIATEHQYATLFDLGPYPMWVCELDSLHIVAVNEAALRAYGYTRAEFLALRSQDLRAPEDLDAINGMLAARWGDEAQHQRRGMHQRKNGARFPVDVVTHRIDFDGRPARIVLAEDVTEREETLVALHESEAQLRTVTDGVPMLISLIDVEQRYRFVNAGYERQFGRPRGEIIGMTVRELVGEVLYERAQPVIERALAGTEGAFDVETPGAGGALGAYVQLRFVPRRDASGKVIGCFTIVSDETDRRHLQEQFRQAQRMEAVGQLAGGVAHDFNNMLTVIMSYVELLAEDPAMSEEQQQDIDEVRQAARRAGELTRQLLAFSRKQTLQPRVIDLNHVVADTEKMLRRLIGEDISLELALQHPLSRVFADPSQLNQVLVNLIVNARDAMPTGGRILIETSEVEIEEQRAAMQQLPHAGTYVMLTVHDTGCGMDAETQSRAFDPFFTTKEPGKGTGLGLSTVYGIIKQSDGHILLRSAPGAGTTFEICLPVCAADSQARDALVQVAKARGGDEMLLLVEDEAPVRTLARRALESRGYQVLSAANGKEALAMAESYQGRIHLLVTDVVMPEMGGIDLAHALSRARADVRLLFVSGYAAGEIGRRGALPADAHFLAKPFSIEGLTRAVRRSLDN